MSDKQDAKKFTAPTDDNAKTIARLKFQRINSWVACGALVALYGMIVLSMFGAGGIGVRNGVIILCVLSAFLGIGYAAVLNILWILDVLARKFGTVGGPAVYSIVFLSPLIAGIVYACSRGHYSPRYWLLLYMLLLDRLGLSPNGWGGITGNLLILVSCLYTMFAVRVALDYLPTYLLPDRTRRRPTTKIQKHAQTKTKPPGQS